jgi:16S rRNA pseudouridine516 synthase
MKPETMRLDRLLSQASGLSRNQVKAWLRRGAVQVAGVAVRDAALQVRSDQYITLDDVPVDWPRERYVMLHKPVGYVCSTTDDGNHAPVASLIDQPWAARLHSAGRLDADSTGLVLLTTDGHWSHALTSPRRQCFKTYLVGVRHPLTDDLVDRFANGILLNDDPQPTLPAKLELLDALTARVQIQEGRYHQVRRMFAACSNRVETLHRTAIGHIALDGTLQPGEWRELTPQEINGG